VKLREAPQVKVFEEIGKEHPLKHVDDKEKHDGSVPKIEPTAHVGENPMKAVLTEVQATVAHKEINKEIPQEHQLKHVETKDAGAPKIEADVHVREAPQKQVFAEIGKDHALKHVDDKEKHDVSAPKVEAGAHIGEAPQKKVLEELTKEKPEEKK